MNTTTTAKTNFSNQAAKAGLKAGYSGKTSVMLVSGEESQVKKFLRLQCLKGKGFYPFKFKMGAVTP